MNRVISAILQDKSVRGFLFKYSALILAFSVTTMFGAIQSLAPLENEVFKEFYAAEADLQLIKNHETISPERVRASARFTAAKHSKDMISSIVDLTETLCELGFVLWFFMFMLAATHWMCFIIEDKRPWER